MPIKTDRQYRAMPVLIHSDAGGADEGQTKTYIVEGYATTFNSPYRLYGDGETAIYEEISPDAFKHCDMSDVVFQYNHSGMVYARSRSRKLDGPTLTLAVDETGLFVRADLSKTQASREIYEAIECGLIDQMSFGFTIEEETYNKTSRTFRIEKVRKLYDVSAVDFPANPDTSIDVATRSRCEGVIAAEQQEQLGVERKKLLLKINLLEV